jgi:preprotein translocase subunit SecG
MLYGFLVFLYVVVSLFLIAVVLLQTGKRADLAGAFGGGGSQTAFGSRGAANLLTKLTTGAAVAFMILALVLSIYGRSAGGGTVLDDLEPQGSAAAVEETADQPAEPAQPAETSPPVSDGDDAAGDAE